MIFLHFFSRLSSAFRYEGFTITSHILCLGEEGEGGRGGECYISLILLRITVLSLFFFNPIYDHLITLNIPVHLDTPLQNENSLIRQTFVCF